MDSRESNRLRDKILEILEANCTDNTGTDVRPLYPLLHFFEAELHEYGLKLQGKVLDLEGDLNNFKEKVSELNGYLEDRHEEIERTRMQVLDAELAAATLTEKLDLAQTVIRSLAKQESWDKAQIICINYLFDQTGDDLQNYVFPKQHD